MEDQNCNSYLNQLWDLASGRLARHKRDRLEAHLVACETCQEQEGDVKFLGAGLRALPRKNPPAILAVRLAVAASREHSRRKLRNSVATWFRDLPARARMTLDNVLKPLAIPATGGILASFLCFFVIIDALHIDYYPGMEAPLGYYTEVVLDDISPFETHPAKDGRDVLVQLTVDEQGSVRDFTPIGNVSAAEMQEIGNLVLYSSFRPATRFGRPVTGKILFNIQHCRVKG